MHAPEQGCKAAFSRLIDPATPRLTDARLSRAKLEGDKDFSLTRSRVRQCELLDGTDTWDVGQAGSLTRRLTMCGVRLLLSQNAVMTRRYG